MKREDRWVEPEIFRCIVENTPLVSIDIILLNKNEKILLGLRKNRPAKGFWFVPGGRIFKGETRRKALEEISKKELGVELSIENGRFLGVFEHFYRDSFFGEDIKTHYVVLAYLFEIRETNLKPDNQHETFKWFSLEEALTREDVHRYTKDYIRLLTR